MANSVYHINKGINASIEFKGLKAQYIWYLGGGILILMIIFSTLYIIGLNTFLCLGIIGIAGAVLVMKLYAWSSKYGEHGMMKVIAQRKIPKTIKSYGRRIFQRIEIEI